MSTGPSVCLSVSLPLSLWRMNWAFWQHTHTHTHIHTHTHTHTCMHACVWGVYIYIYIYIGCLFNSQFSPASMLHGTSLPAASWVSLSLSLSLSHTHTHTLTRSLFLARARALSGLLPPALARSAIIRVGLGVLKTRRLQSSLPPVSHRSLSLTSSTHSLSRARSLSRWLARSLTCTIL